MGLRLDPAGRLRARELGRERLDVGAQAACGRGRACRGAMFSRRTATFMKTTPASSAPMTTIQTTPLGDARPALGRGRGRGRGAPGARRPRPRRLRCDRRHYSTFSATRSRAERGARVHRRLAGARPDRPRREDAHHRLVATDADREVGRARAAARLLPEPVLDDPVLQRVEADHGETTTRPEHLDGGGSASSSASSSSFTAIRKAWKTRLAGWPSPNLAGAGIAALITSTSSPVRSNGCFRRRRPIARAICRAKRSSP